MKKNTITIGRDKKCDLVIPDITANGKVSANHATIKSIENDNGIVTGFILEDHSTNGTYVNTKFVHEGTFYIKESDVIKLGPDYVLDWKDILPLFGIRITREKASNVEGDNLKNVKIDYESPDPVYPDQLPVVDDEPNSQKENKDKFVFTAKHLLITSAALIIGFILGLLFNI